jgi:Dynein heavy chain, N-terminal region 1
LFILKFKGLRDELNKEIERSKSNARYLKLLVEPCLELESSEYPKDVPPKLPHIIFLIRVISLNSEYYREKKNTERLFAYLSNEIINYCKSKVDIPKILSGHPRFGIKICDMSIDCCLAYKQIFKRLLEQLQTEDFRKTWIFDDSKIFNQIDIFIQRLTDIMEICETIIVFGRCDETVTIPPLTFGCYNAREFTMTCKDMEKKFESGLREIKSASHMILNVHNKDWYREMSSFKKLIRSLEEVVQNLLVNVFISINNVEEALDVLTTMHNFSKRKSLQAEYIHKVEQMWSMFEKEIIATNKDITRLDKEHLDCLPLFAGKSTVLHIKLKRCERIHNLLMGAHYLPKVPVAEEKCKMYELAVENIKKRIENYNNEWCSNINPQPGSYLTRFLINRSPTHGGLLECNIDRNILPIFNETKYFDFIDIPLPSILIQTNPKAKKITNIYNKVVNVILLHNKILCSLSDKERLLFREHIRMIDRKLSPGLFRLTYSDEITNDYVTECLKFIEELQHFVSIYKAINTVNVRMFEQISNGSMLNINLKALGTLDQFKKKFRDSRNSSVSSIGTTYKRVIEYIIVIFEGFENHLTGDIAEKWMHYVRKIDALAEYAILNCAKNTLLGVFNLLNGKNNMSPEPFISIDITLTDRQIEFEPSLESVAKSLNNIYRDVLKSIGIFPRLNDKFELPTSPEIRKFADVVNDDKDCRKMLNAITDVIEHTFEKTGDYIYNWQHFRSIWDIDIDRFMLKYQDRGLELKEFESAMLKYYDVANQVMMQDTVVTINYLTFNCSKLKELVLDYIAGWKKSYKQTLCGATLKKLEKLNVMMTSRISTLNEQPTCFKELEASMKLHELSMKEIKSRETDMEDISQFYSYLGEFFSKNCSN